MSPENSAQEQEIRYPERRGRDIVIPALSRKLNDLVFSPNPKSFKGSILTAKIRVHGFRTNGKKPSVEQH
ncbi:MAG: hypothetical protein KAY24_06990 [Candidatus Eisenbacteria sp.]|nr:hypothetical protein [Candidatus Eisenbacteria bacterium]